MNYGYRVISTCSIPKMGASPGEQEHQLGGRGTSAVEREHSPENRNIGGRAGISSGERGTSAVEQEYQPDTVTQLPGQEYRRYAEQKHQSKYVNKNSKVKYNFR